VYVLVVEVFKYAGGNLSFVCVSMMRLVTSERATVVHLGSAEGKNKCTKNIFK
jgi:hypothetical protein